MTEEQVREIIRKELLFKRVDREQREGREEKSEGVTIKVGREKRRCSRGWGIEP